MIGVSAAGVQMRTPATDEGVKPVVHSQAPPEPRICPFVRLQRTAVSEQVRLPSKSTAGVAPAAH